MSDKPQANDIEILKDLDRIRDKTLQMEPMCRGFCDYLCKHVGFDEVHVLVRNEETGVLDDPTPGRPLSTEVQEFIARLEQADQAETSAEDTILGLSLKPREKNLGLLVLRTFDPMSEQMRRAGRLAMSVIDSSVEHSLTFSQLQQRNLELEAIFALDHLRDEHLPFDQMIDQAARKILEYVEADGAAVVLFNEATRVVDIRFPSGVDCSDFQREGCIKALRDLAFSAFELKSLVSVERIHESIGSALCVPLILDRDIIGAFVVIKRGREAFIPASRRLLAAMASQIDTAIFEDMQRQRIKGVFTRYVAADVVEEMLNTDRDFFDGKRCELSVLFSDLRGFTAVSERLDTDTVVRMLNEHLSAMTKVVLHNRGTLDKFIGDCVMAFWGAPVDQPDHAWLAVKTAVEMRAAHEKLLDEWRSRGLDPILIGIGINTGDMFVGNIGDERKSSYTVIGDAVNLASRLEGVARGREILITERTLAPIRDRIEYRVMEPVRVKGKADEIPLFDVVRIK